MYHIGIGLVESSPCKILRFCFSKKSKTQQRRQFITAVVFPLLLLTYCVNGGQERGGVLKNPPGTREANPGPCINTEHLGRDFSFYFFSPFFVAVSRPEQTNCAKANLGTPALIVTLSPAHSHTFPLSTQHPILSKDEERAEPRAPVLRPPAQIKTANLPSFLSLSLDMFHQAGAAPLCRLLLSRV